VTNLLKEGDVARILNDSVKTIQAWRGRGYGPRYLKIGRSVRYREEDVQAFIDSTSRKSTSE